MGFPPDGSRFDGTIYPGVEIRFRVKYQKLLSGDTRILLIAVTEYNPIPEDVRCKDCRSRKIYRHGFTAGGVQRYKCRDCGLTFIGTDTLKRMRVPIEAVGAAVGMYYDGLSLNAIRRQLDQIYDLYPSDSTVYEWVVRFTKVAVKAAQQIGTVYTGKI